MQFDTFTLRLVTLDDLPAYFRLIGNNRKRLETFFAGTVADTPDIDATKAHLEDAIAKNAKKQLYVFVLVEEDSQQLIGSVQIKSIDWNVPKAEIGYYIDAAYEGKGIITQAVSEVIAFGFGTLKLNKLFIRAHAANTCSVKVAEKNGFQVEGVIRKDYRSTDGTLVDLTYYGLLSPAIQ